MTEWNSYILNFYLPICHGTLVCKQTVECTACIHKPRRTFNVTRLLIKYEGQRCPFSRAFRWIQVVWYGLVCVGKTNTSSILYSWLVMHDGCVTMCHALSGLLKLCDSVFCLCQNHKPDFQRGILLISVKHLNCTSLSSSTCSHLKTETDHVCSWYQHPSRMI